MRTSQSLMDPRLVRQQQEVDLMRSMGMFGDQTQELSGLVNIINSLQAPGMEQERFERGMGLSELAQQQGQERFDVGRQDQLGQQGWVREHAEKVFGLQERADKRADEGVKREDTRWKDQKEMNMLMQLLNIFGVGAGAAADEEDGRYGLDMPAFQRFGSQLAPQLPGGFDIGSLIKMGAGAQQQQRPNPALVPFSREELDRAAGMR